jgi:hypothetical protein
MRPVPTAVLRMPAAWFLATIALVAASGATADVYKWVDKNGVAHYADHPPPPPQMEVTTLKDPSASTGAAPGAVAPTGNTAVVASPPAPPPAPASATGTPAAAAPAAPAAKTAATPTPAAKAPSYSDKELEFRKRRIEATEARDKQAKADAASARKAEVCKQQRARVATLREGGRLVRFDDKGERIDLTDTDREVELRTAEQQMEAACK